ncbi:MAG: LPS export ABC transporter periplasmic protein LptC [Flavobacteriaceae bacterium]|nr:MAG: LPS export ABC transporter periplasmic protein LptC [Flavobacteriaceae bacterium]
MTKFMKTILKSIAVIFLTAMFFSCGNSTKEIRDLLADKNLPIGIGTDISNIYTDSGVVTSKLQAPLLYDFSNRENHPYSEFTEGVRIVTLDDNNDSIVVTGNYAIIYSKTNVSEIRDHVVITNYLEHKKLVTEQLFWDQKIKYFYTEKAFTLYTLTDTIYGVGFDASENLESFIAKNNSGSIYLNEKDK